jgi:oligopeptide/dipeptide ABC transporter ATP-binding protein
LNPSYKQNQSYLLQVDRLRVTIPTTQGIVHAVDDIAFSIERGETLGIVGESGCGKSILCKSIVGLLPKGALLANDSEVVLEGRSLNRLSNGEFNKIRGREIGMIFQDPMTTLNPVLTVGKQIAEPLIHHLGMPPRDARKRSAELMASVGIPNPLLRLNQYPHELSGGLRQRVVIAIALSCKPKLLIADEPTTALDVTVQAEILDLLDRLQRERNMAVILVTHDLGVAATRCQNIAVMYGGKFVEAAPTKTLFSHMEMPYTRALLNSLPRLEDPPHTVLKTIEGQPPNMTVRAQGCCFAPRCTYRIERCNEKVPSLIPEDLKAHRWACWNPLESQRTKFCSNLKADGQQKRK